MTKINLKTTVYIISHNYGRFLSNAVESVLRQSTKNWELLLVNNGSTDNTEEVINLYKNDERIHAHRIDHVNLPSACNYAVNQASGEYVIRLDGDDMLDENALLVMENYLDQHKDAALVFPDYYLMDEFGEVFGQERRKKVGEHDHLSDRPPNGACTLIRRSALLELGGYREDLGAQDGFDLWSKISEKHKCGNVNLPLFYYRKHGGNLTNNQSHILSARRQIKLDAAAHSLNHFRPLIAVIPCRRHFDFCPDLWKEEIGGKSLLEHAIDRCVASSILDHIVVISDNPDVKKIMAKIDDKRLQFVQREKDDTIRSRSLAHSLRKVAEQFDPGQKGVMIVVYLQSAFVKPATIDEAITTLVMNGVDSAMGVTEVKNLLFRRTAHGLESINSPRGVTTDSDLVYKETNTVLATKTTNLMSGSLTGPRVVNFIISEDETYFIDSPKSLEIAGKIVQYQ